MDLIGQGLEVLGGAKLGVELGSVGDPVAMVGVAVGGAVALVVAGDGADPDWRGWRSFGLSCHE